MPADRCALFSGQETSYTWKDETMTIKQIQNLLQYLGYYEGIPDGIFGGFTKEATLDFQKDFGLSADGEPGKQTQEALKQAVAQGMSRKHREDFWKEIAFFTPAEFACKCGRYCDGYPAQMQELTVRIADRARKYFGQPISVISGLRCQKHNAAVGGVWNSQHQYGEAADVYVRGTDPETALAWFQAQKDVRYAYRIEGSDNIHFDIPKGSG